MKADEYEKKRKEKSEIDGPLSNENQPPDNPSQSENYQNFLQFSNAESQTQDNIQSMGHLRKYVQHRDTTCTRLKNETQPPKFEQTESYLKQNARDIKRLEKQVRKMEKAFKSTLKLLNEDSSNSHTYLLFLEKFCNVNPEKDEECLAEIFAEIAKHAQ